MRPSKVLLLCGALLLLMGGCVRDSYKSSVVIGRRGNSKYLVKIRYQSPAARSVYLAGDFNNWAIPRIDDDPQEMHYLPIHKMKPTGVSGEWEILIELSPGMQKYRFYVDLSRWEIDERNHLTIRGNDGIACNYLVVK